MDRGNWWAMVHGVAKSWARVKWLRTDGLNIWSCMFQSTTDLKFYFLTYLVQKLLFLVLWVLRNAYICVSPSESRYRMSQQLPNSLMLSFCSQASSPVPGFGKHLFSSYSCMFFIMPYKYNFTIMCIIPICIWVHLLCKMQLQFKYVVKYINSSFIFIE